MAQPTNEEIVRRYMEAHKSHDYDVLEPLRHKDWINDWPQSGERIRGHANDRSIHEAYPGGLPDVQGLRLVGSEDRWVMSPTFTFQRIVGNGDHWWGAGVGVYPDGSTWHVAMLLELRDGQVYRETWYFAPPLEPADWRKAWVEPTS